MVNTRGWILPTAATALFLSTSEAFLPPAAAPLRAATAASSRRAGLVVKMVGPADLQASLLNRFRSGNRPNVLPREDKEEEERKRKAAAAAAARTVGGSVKTSTSTSSSSSSSKTAKNDDADSLVDRVADLGGKVSRFAASVLEEEGGSSSSSGSMKKLKGVPEDFLKSPLTADEETVRGASAVVGAMAGFALGGPLLALVGAAWTSYSCTVSNEAGEAARGTGKWAIELRNFFAKINREKGFVQKLSNSLGGLYRRFKKDVAPEATLLDKAEAAAQTAIDVAGKVSKELDVPGLVGKALVKGGELSVYAVKGLVKYNEENQVTDKFFAWMRKEVLKEGR